MNQKDISNLINDYINRSLQSNIDKEKAPYDTIVKLKELLTESLTSDADRIIKKLKEE